VTKIFDKENFAKIYFELFGKSSKKSFAAIHYKQFSLYSSLVRELLELRNKPRKFAFT
jgi:hypothetical protein